MNMDAMIPDDIREQIDCKGFAILSRYLDDSVVTGLISDLSENDESNGDDDSVRSKRGVVFARRNLLTCPAVRAFLLRNEVSRLMEAAAPGLIAVRAILFDKTGESNWTVPWHQDRSIAVRERLPVPGFGPWSVKAGVVHVQPPTDILRRMITLRFSLDPCDETNGPLQMLAGSHHDLLDAHAVATAIATRERHSAITEGGGVVIMRPLTLHASSSARIATHRRVLHIEFGNPHLPGLEWAMI